MTKHPVHEIARPPLHRQLVRELPEALRKMRPRELRHHPVMFVVEIGAVVTTVATIVNPSVFAGLVTVWLWVTILFGTLAEAVAEGRGKAQAASLRSLQQTTPARRRSPRRWLPTRSRAAASARATWSSSRPASGSPATVR